VSGPILANPASISGTSTASVGTTITVYSNGVALGTTTVQAGGMWTYSGAGLSGLIGGEGITATAGTGASQSAVSNTVVVAPLPPSVNAPIIAGATTVSGTSSAPEGSTITVYKGGVSIGATLVLAGGTWTLSGIDPALEALDKITATVTVGGSVSGLSNEVIVDPAPILDPSIPPIVTASLVTTGAPQTIYGSSVEPPGSVITVYINGVGQTAHPVVQADGSWSLPGVTLAAGDLVKATVLANRVGVTDSGFSNVVRVSANSGSVTPPPVITGTYLDGATSVSGTSVPGATVDVYANGVYLGTVTADGSGNWTLGPGPGIGPFPSGTILSATATETGKGTSDWSAPVIVGSMLMLLRSDAMTSLTQDRAPIFTHPQKTLHYPSLETIGPNHVFNQTEGPSPQPASPGTLDDDKAYVKDIHSGNSEPEPAVLSDNGRPLVFYELLDNDTKTLYLTKSGTDIVFTITP
jgi:hypothetical protein